MPAKLTLFPTEGASQYFVFREGKNQFAGRDRSSDLELTDPRVSVRHALFQWTGSDWILVDLRSKNGTFVNGSRITEVPLQDGDWISFGGVLARLERITEDDVRDLLSERTARRQRFVEIRRDLDGNLEPQVLLRRLIPSVLDLTGAERGFVLLVKSAGELNAVVAGGFQAFEPLEEHLEAGLHAIERVLSTGTPVVTSDARAEAFQSRRRTVLELGVGAMACVALKWQGRVVGLIFAGGRRSGGVFTQLDLEILESLADHTALVFGGLRLENPIRELVGAPAVTVPAGSRSFLDELERRAGDIARAAMRVPRPTV